MVDKTRVFNQDCILDMLHFTDGYFDLAIVDPPYGVKLCDQFKKYGDVQWNLKPSQEYFSELQRVSMNQIIWGWNYFSDMLPPTKAFIYWDKLNHHDNRADGELAYTSFDTLPRHFEYMWDGNRYGTKGNIQGVGLPTIRIHPTQKPVPLYKWLLKNYAKEGDKILDTHLGSGSSRIAAFDMGFDFTGYELDKDYFEAAEKRFQQHKAQLKFDFSPGGWHRKEG